MTNPRDVSEWIAGGHAKRLVISVQPHCLYAFVYWWVLTGIFRPRQLHPALGRRRRDGRSACIRICRAKPGCGRCGVVAVDVGSGNRPRRGLRLAKKLGPRQAGPVPIPLSSRDGVSDMTVPGTLSFYIARQFTRWVTAMAHWASPDWYSMFDFIELLRHSTTEAGRHLRYRQRDCRASAALYRHAVLPFAVLVGGILCFWRLTRSSELIVARAAGISAWEFLAAPTACAFFLEPPVGSTRCRAAMFALMSRSGRLSEGGGGPLDLTGGQLWLAPGTCIYPTGRCHHPANGVLLWQTVDCVHDVSVFPRVWTAVVG